MQASTTNTHRPEDAKLQTSAPSFGSCVTAPILHLPEVSGPEAACTPWPVQPSRASEHGKQQLGGSQRMSFYRNQQLAGLALCFQSQQLTLQPRRPTHTSPLSCIRCMWHDEHKACPTLPGFYNTCTTTGAHLPLGEELPCILHQHSASDTPAQRGARLVPDSSVLESPILYHSMLEKGLLVSTSSALHPSSVGLAICLSGAGRYAGHLCQVPGGDSPRSTCRRRMAWTPAAAQLNPWSVMRADPMLFRGSLAQTLLCFKFMLKKAKSAPMLVSR